MTRRVVHFGIEILCHVQPACENAAGRDIFESGDDAVPMTDREEEVTCRRCLKALGYEPAPVEQFTLVEADPLRRAA